ncbi:MAG TPA: glycoside hydrolase family 3 N-terminal domain-containing protein [Solirubrobacteraceae bacterium]|nr:glycoside hydrolase family 3 N-terminal domain-containing protein [Solirubrobacteraceae bacterium]
MLMRRGHGPAGRRLALLAVIALAVGLALLLAHRSLQATSAPASGHIVPRASAPAVLAPAQPAVASTGGGAATPTAPAPAAPKVSDSKLLGQRIMVGLDGTSPSQALLDAVRNGQVGSVILFAANIVDRPQITALTSSLQRAARAGGNPPVLIAIDQEGGQVKRFPYGPPFLSPPQMAQRGSVSEAYRQGALTGGYLRARGINWDLAPVLDVPTYPNAFIWQQGRAFSFDSGAVARYAGGFARGVQSAGIAATGKHFPGVGSAAVDTDNQLNELRPTASQRRGALVPYRSLIGRGLDSVMLSTAGFPAYDSTGRPTALSPTMIRGLLRGQLGFQGVTITDSLNSPTGHDEITAGVLAAQAGADVLLFIDSAPGELGSLLRALHGGRIGRADAVASYERIVALKHKVAR